MFDLSGKGALVTGASGGIGGAVARTLHAQGASVVLSGTKADKLQELAASMGERAHVIACDLADRAAVAKLAGEAEAALGHLDILVNNAGLTKDNLFMLLKDEDWDRVIGVNLTSTFTLCRAAVRPMIRRKWGRIINITSISGIIGNPGQANYAASKAGMIGMSKSMAREVAGKNITVNCVAPGFIRTPMTDALKPEQQEQVLPMIPAGKFGMPEDIAAAVVFLASNESSYITGQTLHVNGGMAMI